MTFWDRFAFIYDLGQSLNSKVRKKFERTTELLVPTGSVVLDTAAGTGVLTFAAAKKAKRVVCTDVSLPMLAEARKKAERNNIENVEFDERDIFNLKDEDETYDIVMAGNVLHLIDNPELAVKELWRVTKKGGKLLLPTYMCKKSSPLLKLYRLLGFNQKSEFTYDSYGKMLCGCKLGRVKMKLIDGLMPCCYAVIEKGKDN